MSQSLRLFPKKYVLETGCVDLTVDDLHYRKLRQTEMGSPVLFECRVSDFQQDAPMVRPQHSTLQLAKHYAQALGPGLHLSNIEVLETDEGKKVSESGATAKPGSRIVISATLLPIHGWGQAVGYRET